MENGITYCSGQPLLQILSYKKNAPNGSVIFKLTRLRCVNAEYAMKIIDGRRGTDNALAVDR